MRCLCQPGKAGPWRTEQAEREAKPQEPGCLLSLTLAPSSAALWLKAQRQRTDSSSRGWPRGSTHSKIFSFSIPGRAPASAWAPPSPRAFQDSLGQTRNPSCESGQEHKGKNRSGVTRPPHRLDCYESLLPSYHGR